MSRRRGSRSSRGQSVNSDEFGAGIDCPAKPPQLHGRALEQQLREIELRKQSEAAEREQKRLERKAAKTRQNQIAVGQKRKQRLKRHMEVRNPVMVAVKPMSESMIQMRRIVKRATSQFPIVAIRFFDDLRAEYDWLNGNPRRRFTDTLKLTPELLSEPNFAMNHLRDRIRESIRKSERGDVAAEVTN